MQLFLAFSLYLLLFLFSLYSSFFTLSAVRASNRANERSHASVGSWGLVDDPKTLLCRGRGSPWHMSARAMRSVVREDSSINAACTMGVSRCGVSLPGGHDVRI